MWQKFAASLKIRLHHAADVVGSYTGKVTGTQRLETLKFNVNQAYDKLTLAKTSFVDVKNRYYSLIESRKASQIAVNSLLQRKSMWTAEDLSLFTQAVSREHEFENEEKLAKQKMVELEEQVEKLQNSYEDVVRERYQEELLVAERNRGISNILTWSLMLANLGMFCISQLIVEPYRQSKVKQAVRQEVRKVVESIETDYAALLASISTLSDKVEASTSKVNELALAKPVICEYPVYIAKDDLASRPNPPTILQDKGAPSKKEESETRDQIAPPVPDSVNLHAITLAMFFAITILATVIKAS